MGYFPDDSGAYQHLADTLANRPAASADNAGSLYFATDVNGGTLYRSNGSSWVATGPGVDESALRTTLWIPANKFDLGTGTPSRATPNDTPAINLSHTGSIHRVIALIDPVDEHIDHWATFHIDVRLSQTSAESGIARIRTVTAPVQIGDGDTIASASGFTAANWTALGNGVVDDFRARSDVAVTWSANKVFRLIVERNPGGETGGIATPIHLLGVRLIQAS